MTLSERTYLRAFSKRSDSALRMTAWLHVAMAVLNDTFETSGRDVGSASKRLAETWTFAGRRALAYASYCLWYRPLWKIAQEIEKTPRHPNPWFLSKTYNRYSAFIATHPSPKGIELIETINKRLNWATLALRATTLDEIGYRSFQEELFLRTLEKCAASSLFKSAAEQWPNFKEKTFPSPQTVEIIQKLNPASLAKQASVFLLSSAQDISCALDTKGQNLFSTMPQIRPLILNPTPHSGCYNYTAASASYAFNESMPYCFSTFLNFITCCLHESEHLLGMHLARHRENLGPNHPLRNAALLFSDEMKASDTERYADLPVSFYGSTAGTTPLMSAYLSRPTEYYAYRATAYAPVLAQVWGAQWNGNWPSSTDNLTEKGLKHLGLLNTPSHPCQQKVKDHAFIR